MRNTLHKLVLIQSVLIGLPLAAANGPEDAKSIEEIKASPWVPLPLEKGNIVIAGVMTELSPTGSQYWCGSFRSQGEAIEFMRETVVAYGVMEALKCLRPYACEPQVKSVLWKKVEDLKMERKKIVNAWAALNDTDANRKGRNDAFWHIDYWSEQVRRAVVSCDFPEKQ